MININHIDLRVQNMRTRMPFRFGISTMTDVPHLLFCLEIEENGKRALGYSSDHLPPKWFTKSPETSLEEEIEDMISVIRNASSVALSTGPSEDLFTHWYAIHNAQKSWATKRNIPGLLWGFGVSLVERAMIDAFCRLHATNFGAAIRSNIFGLRFDIFDPDLKGINPVDILPQRPDTKTIIRHTIGLSDPLTEKAISKDEQCNDGLPQSLDEVIDYYGIYYFKIKLFGEIEHDLSRLRQVAAVLDSRLSYYKFTLDGNENYDNIEKFHSFWDKLQSERSLKKFLGGLICIEQPLSRNIALDTQVHEHFANWPRRPPFIIDESDGEFGDVIRALEIGYSGTSYKNCKGVFKGLFNIAYLNKMKKRFPESIYMVTSEDLSNIGPIALMQDLAVVSSLGLTHTERNSYHYFKGLTPWPTDIQEKTLDKHSDLFVRHQLLGYPHLNIKNGEVSLKSVTNAPFGTGFEIDISNLTKLDDWKYSSMGVAT